MSKAIFKKLKENIYERTDSSQVQIRAILNKEELIKSKKLLEKEISDRQGQLASIDNNLLGISKAK